MASATAQVAGTAPAGPSRETTLEHISVEGDGTQGRPPATGTVGQPPKPYAGGQVGSGARLGALGNRSYLSTPFNVTGFTDKLIRDQQAQSVADVALNDPSVRADAPPFSERDAFFIRGFPVNNLDTAFDGLFYIANPRRNFLDGIERVEILKGPSAFLNGGLGRVGGTINLVPKRAADEPLTRLTTGFMSDSQIWTHLDVARRFGANQEWGVRANGSYRKGDTAFDKNETEVGYASLGLDYRGERLRASFDYVHSTQNLDAPTSLFNGVQGGVKIPRAPNGRTNTANPWEYHDSESNMVAGRVEFDVLPDTTVYMAGGASRYREDFLTTSYVIGDLGLTNPRKGDAMAYFGYNPQQIQGFTGEVGVRSKFETGFIGHQINVSASRAINENDRGRFNPRALGFPSYQTNIYNPVHLPNGTVDTSGLPRSKNLIPFADLLLNSYAVSDTLSFAQERLQVTVGGRYQEMRQRGFNTVPDIPDAPVGDRNFFYKREKFSPAVAAVARLTESLSVYANYVEALTEGPSAPFVASNYGQQFPPVVSKQKEAGVKYDFGAFATSLALFEIKQPNGITEGAFSVNGLQVNRGVEFTAFGEPLAGLRFLGGVTYIDPELSKTAGGGFDGNVAPGVPKWAVNLYAEYDTPWLTPGLTFTGRMIYTGKTYYDQANIQKVPDWTRFDLGARYAFTGPADKPVTLRANVNNVFDKGYWASSARGFLAGGAPRTFTLSASIDF